MTSGDPSITEDTSLRLCGASDRLPCDQFPAGYAMSANVAT